ncbi:MAG: VOC family protein [Rhodospirillales bacterium]|nr:VOC family protein [Rhodospirillales bacterium]
MTSIRPPGRPSGLNHLVINVRDMEATHRFWTEMLGFRQVGYFDAGDPSSLRRHMRFYSGDHGEGRLNHHDIAFVEVPSLPAPGPDGTVVSAIGHIAIGYADREAWLRQLAFLQASGVRFERRVEHGMTHSLYIRDPNGYSVELLYELPRAVWEGDIHAALNHYVTLPTEGPAALEDRTDGLPVFAAD